MCAAESAHRVAGGGMCVRPPTQRNAQVLTHVVTGAWEPRAAASWLRAAGVGTHEDAAGVLVDMIWAAGVAVEARPCMLAHAHLYVYVYVYVHLGQTAGRRCSHGHRR